MYFICACFDQPNRRIRTRMPGGVGGAPREGRPYPYVHFFDYFRCEANHRFAMFTTKDSASEIDIGFAVFGFSS